MRNPPNVEPDYSDLIEALHEEREKLIYDFDKVKPENRERYEAINKRLMEIDDIMTKYY